MLKNNDIISQLTDSQKVRILTGVGSLSGKDFKILGLSGVKAANMKDYGRDIFPRASALAHSWDEELWQSVAKAKTNMIIEDGADIAIAPGPKIKFSPYRREISEDPYLAERISASYAYAAKKSGITTALSGYYLTESDTDWMDKDPSRRVVNEFMAVPFIDAASGSDADAIMTDIRSVSDSYRNISHGMQMSAGKTRQLICESATEENTVDFISRGIICLSASQNALETAIKRYRKLKSAIEKGEGVTTDQLKEEEINNRAISDERIDIALDKVIDFLRSGHYAEAEASSEDYSELSDRAIAESCVLLKNKNYVLPIDKSVNIALIGGNLSGIDDIEYLEQLMAMKSELRERGYNCVGAELGYDVNDIQKGIFSEKALRLADSVSTVILFLGFDKESERNIQSVGSLSLPPNQLKLADMLVKRRKKVIGIIGSGHAPDIAFTRGFSALMLAPLGLKSSLDVLISIITGKLSPSGKLAYTLYAESDTAFKKRELYKEKYGLRSGPFIGYRYYDTAKVKVGYPFGHGLSYTKFEYSNIFYENGNVRFTVENIGSIAADEIAQVYIGCPKAKVLRPDKELCGFARISLAPGEKKTVEIKIKVPRIYQSGEMKNERGEYEIFVGASIDDIRLSLSTYMSGNNLVYVKDDVGNYIQSVTNVTKDNFTLEAKYRPMKKRSNKNMLIGFGLLALGISLAIFNSTSDLSSVFLGVVASLLAVFAVVFMVSDLIDRSRSYEDDRKRIDEKNKEYFSNAEQLPVLSVERMFNDEFDSHFGDDVEAEAEEDIDAEISKYVDSNFRMADFVNEFLRFAEERGLKFDSTTVESFVASFATSRLVVVDSISSEDFNALILLLSDYFTTRACVDVLDEGVTDAYSLFFAVDDHGDRVKRASVVALTDAQLYKEKLQIVAFDNVSGVAFENIYKSFEGYLRSPKDKNEIKIYNDRGANIGYTIPKNVKIVLRLSDILPIDTLPVSMLRMVAYNPVSYVRCKPSDEHGEYHGCNRYQLDHMLDKEGIAQDVNDKIYVRVDKLESYVRAHSDYKIGNKLWLSFEKQMGTLLSLGKEMEDAMDIAIATKLLPSMSAAIHGNLTPDDDTLKGTIEFIFGDENVSACLKFVSLLQDRTGRLAAFEAGNAVHEEVYTEQPYEGSDEYAEQIEETEETVEEYTEDTVEEWDENNEN